MLGSTSSVQAAAKTVEARIARVYPKRVMGSSSELDEVVAGVDGVDEIFELVAVGLEVIDLGLDHVRRHLLQRIDDVGFAERPVPGPGDRALCDRRVGRDRLAECR